MNFGEKLLTALWNVISIRWLSHDPKIFLVTEVARQVSGGLPVLGLTIGCSRLTLTPKWIVSNVDHFQKNFFLNFFFWKHFAYQTFFAFHCVSNKILHSQPYTENTGMPLEAKTWISMLWISFRRHFFLHYYLKNTDSYGVYTSLWCQYDDLSPLYTHFGAVEIVSDLFFDTKSQQYFQKYNSSKFNSLKIFKDQYLWENFTDLYKLNLI